MTHAEIVTQLAKITGRLALNQEALNEVRTVLYQSYRDMVAACERNFETLEMLNNLMADLDAEAMAQGQTIDTAPPA